MNSEVCHHHSGFKAKIEKLEDDVKTLWDKWDGVQKLLVGTMATMVLNLICVVFLLLR